jgi:2-polyprenyl-3-methyl-5-hydroxy-6-metoxy-1,4-benzoquinol methylase
MEIIPPRLYAFSRNVVFHIGLVGEISRYIPKSGSVIDIGCGYGVITKHLAKLNENTLFVGIDFSHKRIKEANRHKPTNVEFFVQNAMNLNDGGMAYDAILMIDVLHHIKNIKDVDLLLRACIQRLIIGGRIIIKDFEPRSYLGVLFAILMDMLVSGENPTIRNLRDYLGHGETNYLYKPVKDILPYPHYLLVLEK